MPSRAFCSDESQGYPIILLTKHFGTFPFNHGRVGGIVATDRNGPHAHHGKDLFIIQASHVGYDPASGRFGVYRRLQTENQNETTNCGKICGTLDWYLNEYHFACNNIYLYKDETGHHKITIDNQLLHTDREEGLILNLEKMIKIDDKGNPVVDSSLSTSKIFSVSQELNDYLTGYQWNTKQHEPIGAYLHPDLFSFKRNINSEVEGRDHLEHNLINVMPNIVTSD